MFWAPVQALDLDVYVTRRLKLTLFSSTISSSAFSSKSQSIQALQLRIRRTRMLRRNGELFEFSIEKPRASLPAILDQYREEASKRVASGRVFRILKLSPH